MTDARFIAGLREAAACMQDFMPAAENVAVKAAWLKGFRKIEALMTRGICEACDRRGHVLRAVDAKDRPIPCTHDGIDPWKEFG